MDDLNHLATRHALGFLPLEEMVQLANNLLADGYYSEVAVDLAEFRFEKHPSTAAVVPLFLELLRERSVEIPAATDATWTLLRQRIGQIVHDEVPALHGLKAVAEICQSEAFPDGSARYVGQPFGVTALYAAYWIMEDLDARPQYVAFQGKYGSEGMAELTSHVKVLTELWWKVHGPSPLLAPDSLEARQLVSAALPYHDRQLATILLAATRPRWRRFFGCVVFLFFSAPWFVLQ